MDSLTDYYSLAMQYRSGLDSLYQIINSRMSCECNYQKHWMNLMDIGVAYDSAELRSDGVICVACSIEYAYAKAIGEDLFNEMCLAKITAVLGAHFNEPVLVNFEDEEGNISSQFMEKEAYEKFIEGLEDI